MLDVVFSVDVGINIDEKIILKFYVDVVGYVQMYVVFVLDFDVFWGQYGQWIDWIKFFIKVKNMFFESGNIDICWFEDGMLNVVVNCIDCYLVICCD